MSKTFKKLPFFIFLLISSSSWSIEIDWNKIEKKDGLYYEKSKKKIFTGRVNGKIKGEIIDGKKEGKFLKFYKNGNKLSEINYNNNIIEGEWKEYFRNGNLLIKKIIKITS